MKIIKPTKKEMTIEDLAVKIDGLVNKKDLSALATKGYVDTKIGELAIMIEKGFAAMAKQEDLLALTKHVDVNNLKTKGDIASLDFRVSKLEKNVRP